MDRERRYADWPDGVPIPVAPTEVKRSFYTPKGFLEILGIRKRDVIDHTGQVRRPDLPRVSLRPLLDHGRPGHYLGPDGPLGEVGAQLSTAEAEQRTAFVERHRQEMVDLYIQYPDDPVARADLRPYDQPTSSDSQEDS